MGTRTSTNFAPSGLTDHPHAYGDKAYRITNGLMMPGSSPRVWGQASLPVIWVKVAGIIPTRMGTRSIRIFSRFMTKDHPHAYGDKGVYTVIVTSHDGSSPRVWGQVNNETSLITYSRIIPTRMGTSRHAVVCTCLAWDHPHAYGDKCYIAR